MIEKVVHKHKLSEFNEAREDLKYWLSKSPEERVEAVEIIRKMTHGTLPGIQKVVRIVKRAELDHK